MLCPNCAKSIRTDNGMTFHQSWCKAPAPKVAPIVRNATIRPRRPARRARGPEARRQREAASLAAYSAAARKGEHLPVCYADAGCLCSLRNRVTPAPVTQPAPVLDALTICNGCDIRPMADNAAGYCAECLAAAQASDPDPEPDPGEPAPAPKARKAPKADAAPLAGSRYAFTTAGKVGTGKAHAKCVVHEPITLANLGPARMCFIAPPNLAERIELITFMQDIDVLAAARRDAWTNRPTPAPIAYSGHGPSAHVSRFEAMDRETHATQLGSAHKHAVVLRHAWTHETDYGRGLLAIAAEEARKAADAADALPIAA